MKNELHRKSVLTLAPLLVFVVFTICILSVLLTGANTYQNLVSRDQQSFQHRTTVQYLTTRLRQSDDRGQVLVGNFASHTPDDSAGNTLFLREELQGRTFYTRIYCEDGYLRELFSENGIDFSPSDGEKILELRSITFSLEKNLLSIELTYPDGRVETMLLHLRSGKEVAE